MTSLTCWTATDLETQPHVRRSTSGRIEVTLLVGVWSSVPFAVALEVQAEVSLDAGNSPLAASVDPAQVRQTELTLANLAERDRAANDALGAHDWLESTRALGDIRIHLQRQAEHGADEPPDLRYPRTRFYEVTITDLPAGQLLRFVAVAAIVDTEVRARSQPAGVWLVAPELGVGDVVATRTFDDETSDDQWWVLMHRRADGFDHLRLDLLRTANLTRRPAASNLAPVSVALDGRTFDITQPPIIPAGDIDGGFVGVRVDRSTDSVVITRRADGGRLPVVTVTTRTDNPVRDQVEVDLDQAAHDFEPVSVMLIAYAIQGLNDLFSTPLPGYLEGPRSYAEVAYCDELSLFSGRPETQENGVGDGYRFVLGAQLAYQVNAVWAFNAGALLLLKHSLSAASFAELTRAVRDGRISVANAGIGAHRNLAYTAQTNVQEIARADSLIQRILSYEGQPASTDKIYFPDSRIYQATDGERAAYAELQDQGLVDYIVVDRSTLAHSDGQGGEQLYFPNAEPQPSDGNYLWADSRTGLGLLLIEDRLRDRLVDGSDDEVPRGQLHYTLRRLFMQSLVRQNQARPPKLFCFGDDIDHLAGNGWFDGNYRDGKSFSNAFLAALCWFHTHPWVQVRTVDEPGFRDRFLRRELTVSSAIDPSMDPGGASTIDADRGEVEAFHFTEWLANWAATSSPWLGRTLGQLSADLEHRLISWPAEHRNELYEIAWNYFLSCTHESMWSKEPIDPGRRGLRVDPNVAWEPEDFAISESLQMRNAWVYLNAAVWATWAAGRPQRGTFVLAPETLAEPDQAGPLLELVRAAHGADAWFAPGPTTADGLYWDHDNLTNLVVYNAQVLAVLDRNGGRLTQLFCLVDGRPVSVSGTNKAYQFLAVGPPQVACDGQRLQNTVYTPNHAYLATDVRQAAPRAGSYQDQRGRFGLNPTWIPDNLNGYDCRVLIGRGRPAVECRYDQSPADELPGVGVLAWDGAGGVAELCREDGRRLRQGQAGIVWHDAPSFKKTIELDGRRLHVSYVETQPGHLVANEFSVDLLDLLRGGDRQVRVVNRRTATVTSATGFTVTLKLGRNCDFTAATRQAHGPDSRVMTEDVQIVSLAGGDFDYTIELPR